MMVVGCRLGGRAHGCSGSRMGVWVDEKHWMTKMHESMGQSLWAPHRVLVLQGLSVTALLLVQVFGQNLPWAQDRKTLALDPKC